MRVKLFIVFSIVAIVVGFMSCNSDDEQFISKSEKEQYVQDLLSLQKRQFKLIEHSSLNGIQKSMAQSNEDDFCKTAKDLDGVIREFITSHEDILKKSLPTSTFNQDSLELLSVNEEAMRQYLSEHFSQDFIVNFYALLNDDEIALESIVQNLNPVEAFILVNGNSFSKLLNNYKEQNQLSQPHLSKSKLKEETKQQKCTKVFNEQVIRCDLAAKSIAAIGTGLVCVCTFFTSGIGLGAGLAAESFFSAEAAAVYVACVTSAKSDYKKCLKGE